MAFLADAFLSLFFFSYCPSRTSSSMASTTILNGKSNLQSSHNMMLLSSSNNAQNLTKIFTSTGFHSWMWKGLSFLLPFLYAAYAFQFYNGLTLFKLSQR